MPSGSIEDRLRALEMRLGATEAKLLHARREIATLVAERLLHESGRRSSLPIEFRAQAGEDLVAWEIFGHPLEGFFIEAGAYDGKTLSVTYALEAIGWKGLLVEAIPDAASRCAVARPNSRVVNAALAGPGAPPTVTFQVVEGDELFSGISLTPAAQAHLTTLQRRTRSINVPTATLNDMLSGHTGPIDLVSLDLEGGELDALRGFDLARFAPRLLLIEDHEALSSRSTAISSYMSSQPYTHRGLLGHNHVYVHHADNATLSRVANARAGRG